MSFVLEDIFLLSPPGPGGGGGTADVDPGPKYSWKLGQNTPNPCVSDTEIMFETAGTARVSIRVYSAAGRLISTLEQRLLGPGRYSVRWDGRNADGRKVASGVYFYRMEAGDFNVTRKMILMR